MITAELFTMSKNQSDLRRQLVTAYVLFAAMVLVVGGSVGLAVAGSGSVPLVLGSIPVGALFAFFGYRTYVASKRGEVLINERDDSPHERAASFSFYLLVVVILADGAFDVVPNDELSGVLMVVAAVSLVASTVYYRYVSKGFLFRRKETTGSDT